MLFLSVLWDEYVRVENLGNEFFESISIQPYITRFHKYDDDFASFRDDWMIPSQASSSASSVEWWRTFCSVMLGARNWSGGPTLVDRGSPVAILGVSGVGSASGFWMSSFMINTWYNRTWPNRNCWYILSPAQQNSSTFTVVLDIIVSIVFFYRQSFEPLQRALQILFQFIPVATLIHLYV